MTLEADRQPDIFDRISARLRPETQPSGDVFDSISTRLSQASAARREENLDGMGDFTRGVARGYEQVKGMLYGAAGLAGAGAEKAIGVGEDLQNWGYEGYKEKMQEASEYPAIHDWKDIAEGETWTDKAGRAIDWAQGTAGELVPSMVEALISSAIGATAGSAVPGAGTAGGAIAGFFGKKAVKNMIKQTMKQAMAKGMPRSAARKLAKEHVERVGVSAIQKGAMRNFGGKAGIVAGVAPMEAGGNWGELMEQGINNPFSALATGTAAAFLELAGGNSRLVNKILGPKKGKVFADAIKAAERSTSRKITDKAIETVAKLGREAAKQMPEEFMQEAGQEFLSMANNAMNDPSFEMFSDENIDRLIGAGLAGAVGGGMGAVVSTATDSIRKPKTVQEGIKQWDESRKQDPLGDDELAKGIIEEAGGSGNGPGDGPDGGGTGGFNDAVQDLDPEEQEIANLETKAPAKRKKTPKKEAESEGVSEYQAYLEKMEHAPPGEKPKPRTAVSEMDKEILTQTRGSKPEQLQEIKPEEVDHIFANDIQGDEWPGDQRLSVKEEEGDGGVTRLSYFKPDGTEVGNARILGETIGDIEVEEDHRRQGFGREILSDLKDRGGKSLYAGTKEGEALAQDAGMVDDELPGHYKFDDGTTVRGEDLEGIQKEKDAKRAVEEATLKAELAAEKEKKKRKGYDYLDKLSPAKKDLYKVDKDYFDDADKSYGLAIESNNDEISLSNEAGTRTPESLIQSIDASGAQIGASIGKMKKGGKGAYASDATTGNVVSSFSEHHKLKATLEEWKQQYPEGWSHYLERQKALDKIKAGDKVLAPYPTPDNPLGSEWTLIRKNKKTWSIKKDARRLSIVPGALRPIEDKGLSDTESLTPKFDSEGKKIGYVPTLSRPKLSKKDKNREAALDEKAVAEETPQAAAKEPWEMDRNEYIQSQTNILTQGLLEGKDHEEALPMDRPSHVEHIKKALSEGKPVPAEVLRDYPDLAKKEAPQAKEEPLQAKSLKVMGGYKGALVNSKGENQLTTENIYPTPEDAEKAGRAILNGKLEPKGRRLAPEKTIGVTNKSVRDNPQRAEIKDGVIKIINKSGRKTVKTIEFSLEEWQNLEKHGESANLAWNKKEFIRKLNTVVLGEEDENHPIKSRIIDSQIMAIERAVSEVDQTTPDVSTRDAGEVDEAIKEAVKNAKLGGDHSAAEAKKKPIVKGKKVFVQYRHERTGALVEVEVQAKQALSDIEGQRDILDQILKCLE